MPRDYESAIYDYQRKQSLDLSARDAPAVDTYGRAIPAGLRSWAREWAAERGIVIATAAAKGAPVRSLPRYKPARAPRPRDAGGRFTPRPARPARPADTARERDVRRWVAGQNRRMYGAFRADALSAAGRKAGLPVRLVDHGQGVRLEILGAGRGNRVSVDAPRSQIADKLASAAARTGGRVDGRTAAQWRGIARRAAARGE